MLMKLTPGVLDFSTPLHIFAVEKKSVLAFTSFTENI